jgi:hypothetical protein
VAICFWQHAERDSLESREQHVATRTPSAEPHFDTPNHAKSNPAARASAMA